MAKTPRLVRSELTGQFYVVTAYTEDGAGNITAEVKHNVTDQVDQMMAPWVKARDEADRLSRLLRAECERTADSYGWISRDVFNLGWWAETVVHADPCDCDENEGGLGGQCMAHSPDVRRALFADAGAHGFYLVHLFPPDDEDRAVLAGGRGGTEGDTTASREPT